MKAHLLHHDLISTSGGGQPGIYWLRLFSTEDGHLAVVTEVPGNPAASVTNATDEIIEHLGARFGVSTSELTLFEIWPIGAFGSERAVINQVNLGPEPSWQSAERGDIEALIGRELPDLPRDEILYRRVLEAGGGVGVDLSRPKFEAIAVERLPPPHRLFRCEHADRFDEIGRSMPASDSQSEREREIGRRFLASLTADDRQGCRYHRDDWRSIADESVRIIEVFGPQDQADYVRATRESDLPSAEGRWLASLFADPIVIRSGGYSSGQHRSCALRFSGAERAAVSTADELLGHEVEVWKYLGGG